MRQIKRKRDRDVDSDVLNEITESALKGDRASDIRRRLEEVEKFRGRVPLLRTVQRIVADVRPEDSSGSWRTGDYSGEDTRLVMDVLAEVMFQTGGQVQSFTNDQAGWVLWVRKAAPELDTVRAYYLALLYNARKEKDRSDLDGYLAFRPWVGGEALSRYEQAVQRGWVPPVPIPSIIVVEGPQDQELLQEIYGGSRIEVLLAREPPFTLPSE